MVGMIHPRLLDMIVLVKSTILARQKTRTAETIAFVFNYPNIRLLAERFGVESSNILHLYGLLKGTVGSAGRFNRSVFEAQANDMLRYGDTSFEIYCCLLKQLPRPEDRLSLLKEFKRLIFRLANPIGALQFLLDITFQPGMQIDYSDRNALLLANSLLCGENTEISADMERTPEDALLIPLELPAAAHRYAVWRLAADKVYIGMKLEKIQMTILQSLISPSEGRAMSASFLLALEREALIFLSLVGGGAARTIMRRALLRYSDPQSEIYSRESQNPFFGPVMYHLRTIILGIGCMGNPKDKASLEMLRENIERLSDLDISVAYAQQVSRVLDSIKIAVQSIQAHCERAKNS
jgi:hypothetical protein